MRRKCRAWLFIFGVLLPAIAWPLGLGELRLQSFLNEPFRAEVDLLEFGNLDPEQLRVRLASKVDFDRAGVERAYFLTRLKFSTSADQSGNGRLLITSVEPILEPYLDFLIEARWPGGRILREYTMLLDPPILAGKASGMTASASVPVPNPIQTGAPEKPADTEAESNRYEADAGDMPAPGAEYLVQQDETLWRIASRSRPEGATIHQTMLDIRRLNPEAFIGGNINQLKAGHLLRLPTQSQISESSLETAIAEIEQQQRRWKKNLAAIDARALDASRDTGERTDSSSEKQGSLVIAGARDANLERIDEVQRDNQNLRSQMQSMEEQVATLQRLLTLKDDQISTLQTALTRKEIETPTETEDIEGMSSAIPDVAVPEVVEEPVIVQPAAAPPSFDAAPKEDSLMTLVMDYLWLIAAWVVVIVGALVWFLRGKLKLSGPGGRFKQPGRSKASGAAGGGDDDEFAGVELGEDGLIVDEFSEQSMDETLATERGSFSAQDEDAYTAQFESADALAEADIYMAYGRFPQAVDRLKAAILVEPVNVQYRLKLMEACMAMSEQEEMQQQYADLQAIGAQSSIARALELIEAMDAGDTLLQNVPEPSVSPEEIAAAQADAAAQPDAPALDLPDLESDEITQSAATKDETGSDELDVADIELVERALEIEDQRSLEVPSELPENEPADPATVDEDEHLVFAADGDNISTKLDLSRAYIDMGDEEGAKSILKEVIEGGSEAQKQEAQNLIEDLD